MAVDVDRASPALRNAAPKLGADKIEVVAEDPKDRRIGGNINLMLLPVDGKGKDSHTSKHEATGKWVGSRNVFDPCQKIEYK